MNIKSSGRKAFRTGGSASVPAASIAIACGFLAALASPAAESPLAVAPVSAVRQSTFGTPEAAAEALISAAEQFDVAAMVAILGTDGEDLVVTDDPVQDRNQAADLRRRRE